jgi:hypothetical protein
MTEEKFELLNEEDKAELIKIVNDNLKENYLDSQGEQRAFLAGVQFVVNIIHRGDSSVDDAYFAVDQRKREKERADRFEDIKVFVGMMHKQAEDQHKFEEIKGKILKPN